MFLPRGAVIAEELEKLAKETEFAAGYQRVRTPHIARESLYKKSGHLPYYAESMFPPMTLEDRLAQPDIRRSATRCKNLRSDETSLQASQSCHAGAMRTTRSDTVANQERHSTDREKTSSQGSRHVMLTSLLPESDELSASSQVVCGAASQLSRSAVAAGGVRDVLSYEKSGELFGLMRVRSLQMNDAHLYMTPEQFEAEFNAVNEMYLNYFKLFGIDKYLMRFSTHDPAKLGQKFVDEPELWKKTEEMTRNVLKNSGINYVEVPNEAAFYGPKIDVQAWSVIGREFSIATNQVDFAQPRSFDLRYKDRDNIDKIPICIHRAPLGTHERFIGFLIEHYAGNFPLWLSPEQVRILTIGDDPKLMDYARSILNELRAHQVRAELDESSDKINGKIQRAEQMKVHTMFVIGKRDIEAAAVSVRVHGKGNLGARPRAEAIADILSSIKERRVI